MSVRVLFFATLADITGIRETSVEAAAFPDIQSVFIAFTRRCPALEAHRSSTLFALNSEFARPDARLKDGDEIAFFPPVSGG